LRRPAICRLSGGPARPTRTGDGRVNGRGEVHRSTAEHAIADASDRKQEAKNTAGEAKNGYALAQAIKGSVARHR
jgi:hypothetical protein